ncbi:peptidylprolyl isomerase [Tenggerimyces flavus]|uniref:Peptidyl-prolyl cis-trans isomerase n=1 Tax=Tenggerimyces flavus TaxID=1708749 RepID=A0ABV7Y3D2_9ACTN|nr:peptidylprolyl isomerase [Tenggerimyces flavus]MBM7790855.1 cyclophilin family peptidyl-prolyl cis-trans isomerase [Tenggerimyces flavus]
MGKPVVAVAAALVVLCSLFSPGVAMADTAEPSSGGALVRCEYIPTPDKPAAKPVRPPFPWTLARGTVTVTLHTNHGKVVMELDRAGAPCAVHNLAHLAWSRFYHDTQCWRLTDYERLGVLQCGDIFAAEIGGPGYRFADELTGAETYPRGTVAMGNQGPDTNGSQFFLVHSQALIPPAYTVLGRVTHGMDVLDKIAAGGIIPGANEHDGEPRLPVHINRAAVRY